jgi:hypothetical protein
MLPEPLPPAPDPWPALGSVPEPVPLPLEAGPAPPLVPAAPVTLFLAAEQPIASPKIMAAKIEILLEFIIVLLSLMPRFY